MKSLGEFVTRNLWQACLIAFIFALLPLLGWIALVIVALICMRKGPTHGLAVLVAACLPSIIMLAMGWHGSMLQVVYFALTCFVVWLMAILLRATNWAATLQITAGLGVLAVLALHGVYPEIAKQMQAYLAQTLSKANVASAQQQELIELWSQSAVHLFVASTLAFSTLWLALARWWQSMLFNPGKLKTELHNIRLNKYLGIIAVVMLALLLILEAQWLRDIVPVILLPFSIAGLSLFHSYCAAHKIHVAWLVAFYVLLVLLMGVVSSFLAVAAIVDSWFDIRSRWRIKRG